MLDKGNQPFRYLPNPDAAILCWRIVKAIANVACKDILLDDLEWALANNRGFFYFKTKIEPISCLRKFIACN